MKATAKVVGVKDAVAAMGKAFPKDPEQQRRLLNGSMRSAATDTILIDAKLRAAASDASGALAESLGIRTTPRGRLLRSRRVGGVYIAPIRHNPKAIAKYVSFYRKNSTRTVVDGIRHGHLVEFGHATRGGGHVAARPFLWPAAQSNSNAYRNKFAMSLRKKTEAAVRRRARKGKR